MEFLCSSRVCFGELGGKFHKFFEQFSLDDYFLVNEL